MRLLKLLASVLIALVVGSIFSVYLLKEAQLVAATPNVCCEQTLQGNFCVYGNPSQCDPAYQQASTACEQTAFCRPVCCTDSFNGACYPQVSAAQCANKAGAVVHAQDPSCQSIPACERGCCQLGNQCFLSTSTACQSSAASYAPDFVPVWDGSIASEQACVAQCASQEEGCCADSQAGCQWTTRRQCPAANQGSGSDGFYGGAYCSDPALACECAPRARKGCTPGKEDVYWLDSCGNPEGIAQDCNYEGGTLCKEQPDGAVCASVHCETTKKYLNNQGRDMNPEDQRIGGFRANGESWCVYESGIGGFYDRPGSRHYRHMCVNGVELIEPCKDFREEICVQADISLQGQSLSTASCKNLDLFSKIDLKKYQETGDVRQSTVMPGTPDFFDQSKTMISSTTIDKGARFWDGDNKQACAKGEITCNVVWAKKHHADDWDCEANCDCEKPMFLQEAANYCKMFGDCGADINILGKKTTGGLAVKWTGTSKGPHPTSVPASAYSTWDVYGVFDGMRALKDVFDTSLTDTSSFFGAAAITWALASVVYYASLLLNPATITLSYNLLGLAFTGPWGLVALVVIALLTILFKDEIGELLGKLFGYETKTKTVVVDCRPWVAPVGGNDCESCGKDGRECSEYRCKSLGTACELVNVGTKQQSCVWKSPNDVTPPLISPWENALSTGHSLHRTGTGYSVSPDVGYWKRFTFGIEMDEPAQCKWDNMHTDSFDEMAHYFGDALFTTQKNMTVSLPGGYGYTYYVRCSDANGNANVQEYTIQFSTVNEPDLTPPVIEETSIANGDYLPVNTTSVPLWLKLNEPGSVCWWNKGTDAPLEQVPQNQTFLCGNNPAGEPPASGDPAGWSHSCVGLLTGIEQGAGAQSKYYFRCTDLAGNSMQQGYSFVLKGSSPLTLLQTGPQGVLYENDAMLDVVTSGGAEQGRANCAYRDAVFGGGFIPFFSTGGTRHTQPLQDLPRADYTYDVSCEDAARNKATSSILFTVSVDLDPPRIVQVYASGDTAYVITDEPSTCAYHLENPQFSFDQGTLFGQETTIHALLEPASRYYLQCRDAFGNVLTGVTLHA